MPSSFRTYKQAVSASAAISSPRLLDPLQSKASPSSGAGGGARKSSASGGGQRGSGPTSAVAAGTIAGFGLPDSAMSAIDRELTLMGLQPASGMSSIVGPATVPVRKGGGYELP